VKGSALRRAHRAQLSRNAAVALGNSGDPRAVLPLVRAVAAHPIALVRGHAAWALGELGALAKTLAQPALECAAAHDPDVWVREEANAAHARLSAAPTVSVNESSDRSHAAVP
jgi:epoxyqueuosine reductase